MGSYFCINWEDKIDLTVEQYQVIISTVEDNIGQIIKYIAGRGILSRGDLQFRSLQLLSHVRLFVTPWSQQHARPPCPSPTPGVHSNSQPLGEGNSTPIQYSCLENPMDKEAWWTEVHGVAKSQTRLSNFTFTFHFHALEKEMATHSSVLAWRIPGKGEPGGLPSMGSHRVRHD